MAKMCPLDNKWTLYLECLECSQRFECSKGLLDKKQESESSNENKRSINVSNHTES